LSFKSALVLSSLPCYSKAFCCVKFLSWWSATNFPTIQFHHFLCHFGFILTCFWCLPLQFALQVLLSCFGSSSHGVRIVTQCHGSQSFAFFVGFGGTLTFFQCLPFAVLFVNIVVKSSDTESLSSLLLVTCSFCCCC